MIYQPMLEEDLISKDPNASDPEAYRFCSKFLINALLALSCVSELPTFSKHNA